LTVHVGGPGQGSVTSAPSGIDCPSACKHDFAKGSNVVLTPTAASKSFFVGWSGACSGTGTCALTMSDDRDVTATFDVAPTIGDAQTPQLPPLYPPPTSSLSVNVSGDGSVIGVNRGLSVSGRAADATTVKCGLAGFQCYTTVKPGTVTALLAKAGPGYTFQGWSGPCQVSGLTCIVTLSAAHTVSARFAPKSKASTFAAGLAPAPAFKVKWKASIGKGVLKVTGALGKPALAKVTLHRPRGGPLLTESIPLDAGKFTLAAKLLPGLLAGGAHLFPGGFMVSLTGTSGKLKMPMQIQTITLAAPPEGVVRTSYPSTAMGSKPVKSVPASGRQAYANFVLQTQPVRSAQVTVRWYWPNGKLLGSIKKSNRPTIVSFIGEPAGSTLPKGNWVAELRAGNKVVQRLLVRIR
jgi:hypothetical protein